MNAGEVLDTLSDYQEFLCWLANDGRQHLADASLTVFRSDEHFAVFTQFPHFFYRGGGEGFYYWVGCAGNCLISRRQPLRSGALPIEAVTRAPVWQDDGNFRWFADRNHFSILIRGRRYNFYPSAEDYKRAAITFEDEKSGPNTITPGQFLRFLCVALDHSFFYSGNELRALIKPVAERQMSLFLQTSWWQHPESLIGANDPDSEHNRIENIPCWQILSRAVASGDLNEWNAQDTSRFNTDWASLERIYREGNFGYGFDD